MDLVITVNETSPGVLHTRYKASGRATKLEAEMIKHIAPYLSKALDDYDKKPGVLGAGTPLKILERDI